MNFLAHIFLSLPEDEWMVGNFIADEVKGKSFKNFPPKIAQGILMHRFIDDFTDTHPIVTDCKSIIRYGLGKYSPVALDVFFDYFLCLDFGKYHMETLEDFIQRSYSILNEYHSVLPETSKGILYYMQKQNWLLSYRNVEGIAAALNGMAQRSQHGKILAGSEKYLIAHHQELQQYFFVFFKELQEAIANYKLNITNELYSQ